MFSKRFEKQDAECCCSCNEFCFSPPCKPMLLCYYATLTTYLSCKENVFVQIINIYHMPATSTQQGNLCEVLCQYKSLDVLSSS